MNQDSYALSRYRFDKAKEDLESSKVNFQNNLLSASINRSYYSIFHAARALLAFDDFDLLIKNVQRNLRHLEPSRRNRPDALARLFRAFR